MDADMKIENNVNDDFELRNLEYSPDSDIIPIGRSYFKDIFHRLFAKKIAGASLIMILIIVMFAIIAPFFSPYTYKTVNTEESTLPPRVPGLEKLGIMDGKMDGVNVYEEKGLDDVYHYFGTDSLGRDIWTRVAEGTRISLTIAFIAVVVDVCFGILFGLVSGYFGGWVDTLMQRFVEVLAGIPTMVVVTLLLVVLKPGLTSIIIALMLTGWINMSRIVRAQVLKLKSLEYVLASKTMGAGSWSIIMKEMLPNTLGQIIVTFMFSIPTAIFLEAFLAFIGLGVPAPLASLGTLINDGYKSAMTYPYMVLYPVLVLGLLMLCFNLLADGLRDAIDPQMRQI